MITLDNHLDALEKYFAGTLGKEETIEFNQLKNNNDDFEELIDYFNDFMVGIEDFGDKAVLLQLQNLEKVIQKEEQAASIQELTGTTNDTIKKIAKDFFNQIDYTLNQLAGLFLPVSNYQPLLGKVAHRGKGIPLQMSEKDWDLAVESIPFHFSEPTSNKLSIVVENNQRQTLWKGTIAKGSTSFLLTADELNIYTPGRYYWKISDGKESIIQEFFIRKDLMPK